MNLAGASRGLLTGIDESECFDLLLSERVGRVAFPGTDGVEVIPVNFAVVERNVCFRTSHDGPLADLARGDEPVTFQCDVHDDVRKTAWSVMVKGIAQPASTGTLMELRSPRHHLLPWAPGLRDVVVEVRPVRVSGRRVRGRS